MAKRSKSYKDAFYEQLRDDSEALAYLQAAIEDSIPAFLRALRNVAEARNVTRVAAESGLDRVNLYRMLSENGNPRLNSLTALLHAFDLRLSVEPVEEAFEIKSEIPYQATVELPVLSFVNRVGVAAVCDSTIRVDTEGSVSTVHILSRSEKIERQAAYASA